MVAWVSGYGQRDHATIGRFTRWGIVHGPFWGVAAAIVTLPLLALLGSEIRPLFTLLTGFGVGLVGGPILAMVVGGVCMLADRVPKWLLDAPDYVAVLAIAAVLAVIAWPVFDLGRAAPAVAVVGFLLFMAAPAIDAAQHVPELLHPENEPQPH